MPGKVKGHEVSLKRLVTALLLEGTVAQKAFKLAKNTETASNLQNPGRSGINGLLYILYGARVLNYWTF